MFTFSWAQLKFNESICFRSASAINSEGLLTADNYFIYRGGDTGTQLLHLSHTALWCYYRHSSLECIMDDFEETNEILTVIRDLYTYLVLAVAGLI